MSKNLENYGKRGPHARGNPKSPWGVHPTKGGISTEPYLKNFARSDGTGRKYDPIHGFTVLDEERSYISSEELGVISKKLYLVGKAYSKDKFAFGNVCLEEVIDELSKYGIKIEGFDPKSDSNQPAYEEALRAYTELIDPQ